MKNTLQRYAFFYICNSNDIKNGSGLTLFINIRLFVVVLDAFVLKILQSDCSFIARSLCCRDLNKEIV
jgi:hypothetical protein